MTGSDQGAGSPSRFRLDPREDLPSRPTANLREKAQAWRDAHPARPERPEPDAGEVLAVCPRGDGTELRVAWRTYQGRPFLQVQLWERGADGRLWPAKGKGVTIRVRELAAVADGLARALDLAQATVPVSEPEEGPRGR